MKYAQAYRSKLISPEDAAGLVQPNNTICLGGGVNTALIIDKHLARRKHELRNVTVRLYCDILGEYEMLKADPEGEVFTFRDDFLGRALRDLGKKVGAQVYASPPPWHNCPRMIREIWGPRNELDIFYLIVTPMDEHGFFNFGLTNAEQRARVEIAKKVVLVVSEDMPWVYGGREECVHISEVDYIVEDHEFKTPTIEPIPPNEQDRRIAENIIEAELISDGSTIQVGIGGLPNSVMELIRSAGYKDLGIHTEMITLGMVALIEGGLVTNARKKLDRHKSAFTFTFADRRTYDYLNRNPEVVIYPVDYTNDPMIIAQQPNMFSLNSALQIDLFGQVNSESIGMRDKKKMPIQISGVGGQLDFVLGCFCSLDRNAKSVLGLYSSSKGESRIVPLLPAGTIVTVPRTVVQYVATEWGVVNLRGLTVEERALALISIAHPDHKAQLYNDGKKLGLISHQKKIGKKEKGVLVEREK